MPPDGPRPKRPKLALFQVYSASTSDDEAPPEGPRCAQCDAACEAAGETPDTTYCCACWEAWEKEQDTDELVTEPVEDPHQLATEPVSTEPPPELCDIVAEADRSRSKEWWRCRSCFCFLYSELHREGCPHAAVSSVDSEQLAELERWQPVYDPSQRPGWRPDIAIICVNCNQKFNFSGAEQRFFAKQHFESQPTRCQKCRRVNKEAKEQARRARTAIQEQRQVSREQHSWKAIAKLYH